MTLHFDLTIEDYVASNYHHTITHTRSKQWRAFYIILALIMLGSIVWRNGVDPASYTRMDYIVILLAFLFLSTNIFYRQVNRMATLRFLKKDPDRFVAGPRELIFEASCMVLVTVISRTEIPWPQFTALEEQKDYLFVYYDKQHVVIIPKNIFLLPQELYDVQSFIEEKLTHNKKSHEQRTFPETGAGQHHPADTGGHIARMG